MRLILGACCVSFSSSPAPLVSLLLTLRAPWCTTLLPTHELRSPLPSPSPSLSLSPTIPIHHPSTHQLSTHLALYIYNHWLLLSNTHTHRKTQFGWPSKCYSPTWALLAARMRCKSWRLHLETHCCCTLRHCQLLPSNGSDHHCIYINIYLYV